MSLLIQETDKMAEMPGSEREIRVFPTVVGKSRQDLRGESPPSHPGPESSVALGLQVAGFTMLTFHHTLPSPSLMSLSNQETDKMA